MRSSPFQPSFGTNPPVVVGRDDIVDDFNDALDDGGVGAESRVMLIQGARGQGKTVVVSQLEQRGRELGWIVISESGRSGLVDRIVNRHLPQHLAAWEGAVPESRLSGGGLSTPLGSITGAREALRRNIPIADLRGNLDRLGDLLRPTNPDVGILITVDEIHAATPEDLEELGHVVQHQRREGRNIAFVAAGLARVRDSNGQLAGGIEAVLELPGTTFLQRADQRVLHSLSPHDTARAFREPIEDRGIRITDAALKHATDAAGGYPYLIQLIGDRSWRHADGDLIELADVRQGVAEAHTRFETNVIEPALRNASEVDRQYLEAMAVDDGPSRTGDVHERMGVTHSYASVYRDRLLKAGLIESRSRGKIDYALPGMRGHFRLQRSDLEARLDELDSRESLELSTPRAIEASDIGDDNRDADARTDNGPALGH